MGLTAYGWDLYISDNFSKLKKPEIKIIRAKVDVYIPNLVLNQVFNNVFKKSQYSKVLALFSKIRFIKVEYNSFATKLRKFDPSKRSLFTYFDIINMGEITILLCGQVIDLLNRVAGIKLFEKNDGSLYERIYELHNQVKHSEDELFNKKQIQVLKLDNLGIYTTKYRLEYKELRDFIIILINIEKKLMTKVNEQLKPKRTLK